MRKSSFLEKPNRTGKIKYWELDKGLRLQESKYSFVIHFHRLMTFGQLQNIVQAIQDMYPCKDYQLFVDYGEGIQDPGQIQGHSTIEMVKPLEKAPKPVKADYYQKLNRILSYVYQTLKTVKRPIYWYEGRFILKSEFDEFVVPIMTNQVQLQPETFLQLSPIEFDLDKYINKPGFITKIPDNAVGWKKEQLAAALGYDPKSKNVDLTVLYNEYIRRNLPTLIVIQKGPAIPSAQCYLARGGIRARNADPRDYIFFVITGRDSRQAFEQNNFEVTVFPRKTFMNMKPKLNKYKLKMNKKTYVVGMQECMDKKKMRKSLPAFLLTKTQNGDYYSENLPLPFFRQIMRCEGNQ